MAKFGKLELTDDSDEDTDKFKVVSTRKRVAATIIISSDEEDEDSSDLSSLPPSPIPGRRKFLEEEKGHSRDDNAVERVEATGVFSGSIGKSLIGGTSNKNDEDVMVLERPAQNITSPPSVQKKTVPVHRKKEDSDNDSVYEIPPPVQARNLPVEVASMKTIPYNKPSKNSLAQNRTIFAGSTNPSSRIVHTPSGPSSSRTHTPQLNETSSTVKLKISLPPKLSPGRSQKMSSDIMSWNQSKRVQSALTHPIIPPKPTEGLLKPPDSAKSPATLKPAGIAMSQAPPFPFTSKALLSRPKRPLVPLHSSTTNGSLVEVDSGSASADLVPSQGLTKPAEIETGVDIAAPIPATEPQAGSDIDADANSDASFVSPEDDEDVTSTTSPMEHSQLSVESPTPEQHTYVLNSEYDRQLYKAVRSHWAPLAQMREQLANARLTADPDEELDGESGSEGDAGFTTSSGRYGGLGHGWKSGDTGVLAMKITGENGNLKMQPERTHTTEDNVSVALAMRRYTERIWGAASNVPGVWAGAPLAKKDGRADRLEEKEENATSMLSPEVPRLLENPREGFDGLPTRSSNIKTPVHTQTVTLSLSGDPSTTSVPLDTPTTEPSTAATLVNLSTTPKDPTSPLAILLTPLESVSWVLRSSTPVQSPIQSAVTYHASDSCQTPPSYEFSYESTAMHIGSASWDANSFAMVRTIAPNSKSVVQPDSPIQIIPPDLPTRHKPPSPKETSYRPTRHFLGVEPPSIPGTKRYALDAVRGLMEGHEAVEAEESLSEVEDLSESELTPLALKLYRAQQWYHEIVEEDQESAKETRKRKTLDLDSSAPEEEPEYEDYAGPKKKAQRGSRKKRKTSQTIPPIDSGSPLPTIVRSVPTARPLRIRATGMTVEVPLGLSVDDIKPASLEVRQVRDLKVSTTALCHQCRCNNTTEQQKVQCGNVTIHLSSSTVDTPGSITRSARCNKAFCERCLRGWYAFDDDAVAFVKGGQRMVEGKGEGTGIGLGIVEGKWICPFCIDLCMCTVCSKKRQVERTKYAPSASAVIAVGTSGAAVSRPMSTGGVETCRKAHPADNAAQSAPPALSPISLPVIRLPRRIGPPPVPSQWLPAIPAPTPGLDPVFYEATRPCTRDFPTGAPQPTAANHAPIVYHIGADLENDGLEDSFTGSEMSEDEEGGESRVSDLSARIGSSGDNQRDADVTASSVVAQATRKNFLIVTPGRRMPNTMKKTQEYPKQPISPPLPAPSHPPTTPETPYEPDQVLDGVARVSLESPVKLHTSKETPIFDRFPATVDPMQLSGSASCFHAEETPTQGPSFMMDVFQDALNVISQHTDSPRSEDASLDPGEVTVHTSSSDDNNGFAEAHFMPHFDDYEMVPNEEAQIGSPTLAMGDYNDFLPIMGGDDNVVESIDFPAEADGDVLMNDELFSFLLRYPSSQQDPDLLTVDLMGYHD